MDNHNYNNKDKRTYTEEELLSLINSAKEEMKRLTLKHNKTPLDVTRIQNLQVSLRYYSNQLKYIKDYFYSPTTTAKINKKEV